MTAKTSTLARLYLTHTDADSSSSTLHAVYYGRKPTIAREASLAARTATPLSSLILVTEAYNTSREACYLALPRDV